MAEREQLRAVFQALDADARVRVIVLRAGGSIFRAAARSAAFSMPRPSMSRASPGTSPRRRARCAGGRLRRYQRGCPPLDATVFG